MSCHSHEQMDGRREPGKRHRGNDLRGVVQEVGCDAVIALNHCPPSSHQRSLTIAQDLCRKMKSKKAMPYLAKAMEDPKLGRRHSVLLSTA